MTFANRGHSMRRLALTCLVIALMPVRSLPQGAFIFANELAPTRIGSADGPLAGPGIYAQFLAGRTVDSLTPIGIPTPHLADLPGIVDGGQIAVPGVPPSEFAFVRMVAWDSRLWGKLLSGVPSVWLGMTDIVPVLLTDPRTSPVGFEPNWTRPAIVPIPEPSIVVLVVVGSLGLFVFRRRRCL
jgi:hypothetical protein